MDLDGSWTQYHDLNFDGWMEAIRWTSMYEMHFHGWIWFHKMECTSLLWLDEIFVCDGQKIWMWLIT